MAVCLTPCAWGRHFGNLGQGVHTPPGRLGAKMDYMNITAARSAGRHDREQVDSGSTGIYISAHAAQMVPGTSGPTDEEGGSKAGSPPAPEHEISIHFDLCALGDVMISARQEDSVLALAMLVLERVVLTQGMTATMIFSK